MANREVTGRRADGTWPLGVRRTISAPLGGRLLVLGYGRSTPGLDVVHEVRDVVAHRYLSRRTTPWDPPTVRTDPTHTWTETAALTARLLPGRAWRRLPLWRYLVIWDKPVTP